MVSGESLAYHEGMSTLRTLLDWSRQERDYMQERLAMCEAGRMTTGQEIDGASVDTTADTIKDYKRRIAEAERIIGVLERDLA